MNILHIIQSLDPAWGGIARVIQDLASGLSAVGHVNRIATLAGGRYGQPPHVPGVDTLAFPASDGPLGRSREFKRAIPRLVADADLVHLHGLWTAQNWATGAAARRAGKPCLMTPHSMMMPWAWARSAWKKRPIGWLFEHQNLRHAACLHALAPGEAQHMRALGFNDRIETIPNGLWPEQFAALPAPDDLIRDYPELASRRWLLFLGRIAVQKGIVALLQACFDVGAVHADWQLVIAGPDSAGLQRRIAAALARKGMTRRVTFLGMLDRPRVLQALGRAELLVQPSLSEGLSMSILEALAAGMPVLISTACNLPQVAAAGAGRVVEPNRRAVAAALRELLALDRPTLAAMGAAARRLAADQFNWKSLLPKYVEMYERARSRKP